MTHASHQLQVLFSTKRIIFYVLGFVIALFLSSCSSEPAGSNQGTSTITGSIGVASQRRVGFGQQSLSPNLAVQNINSHITSLRTSGSDLGTLSQEAQPLRGLNAAVLGNVITTLQTEESRPLFSLTNRSVVAVDKSGNVLASANIGADGSWALEIEDSVWQEAGTIGLLQGYESNEGWICEKKLEYDDDDVGSKPALFGYDETRSLGTQQVFAAGLFNYDEDTGNPTSDDDNPEPGDDDFDPKCENENIIETSITADFTWQTPSSISESSIYETGVGYALDTRDEANPGFVNVTPLDAQGIMDMEIFKPQGGAPIPLALVISDTDLLKLDSIDDVGQISMPLTPTFDLNAAIRYGNPSEPAQIAVGDEGYAYDPEITQGGMAYISGQVFGSDGAPEANALVIAMIDSTSVLAFNLAISRSDGSYEMLLPATSADLPYYIIALSEDETEVGIPLNVPKYNDDTNELRYAINSPLFVSNADIQMIGGGDDPPPTGESGSISGTLTMPGGEDVNGTLIFICEPDFSRCFDPVPVQGSGSSATYKIDNLPDGQYGVGAQKDSNGDNKADFQGIYTTDGTQPTPVPTGSTNIDITLVALGGNPSPGGAGTISGTVTAPQGKNVENTSVYACFIDGDQCDPDRSVATIIRQSGSSAPYTVEGLVEGSYIILADKDVDLDNQFRSPGDYSGCYTTDGERCTPVEPGATGIDVQMGEIPGGDEPSDPGDPGNDGSVSGTAIAAGGQDLRGALVFICVIENGELTGCPDGLVFQESGEQLPFSLPAPEGDYVVRLLKDTDGNEQLSPGDLVGCAGNWPECNILTGPQQNVTVNSAVVTESDLGRPSGFGLQNLPMNFNQAPLYHPYDIDRPMFVPFLDLNERPRLDR